MLPKIVLIGAGKFGKNHLKTLINLDKKKIIKFVGVVEQDSKIIKEIKNNYKLPVSKNLRDFFSKADGFDVVTPPQTHYKIIKYILEKKKHVFVEKPLTLKSKEANELYLLSKKNKKQLQVGHIFRFFEIINQLKKLIKIKKSVPYYITANFLQDRMQGHDTGAIFIFLHGFDILDNLIELKPKKITGFANLFSKNKKYEINSTVFLQYKNLNANVNVGWIPNGKQRSIEIFSKKNHIICDLLEQQITIFENNKIRKKIIIKQKEEPLSLELKDFARCIKNNSKPKVDGIVGTRIVKICELANHSIKKNRSMSF